jgi:hypothetical protein
MSVTAPALTPGLLAAIARAGRALYRIDGVLLADDDAAVQALIDAWPSTRDPAHIAERIDAIRSEARERIEAKYPEWRQRSAALGLYPAAYVAQMQADIAAVIAASNAAEDAVDAATTNPAAEAVAAAWPVI